MDLKLLNLKLNPNIGLVVVNYRGSLSWQGCLESIPMGDTRLDHIRTDS
jgi:hypothetical protein